MWLFGYTAVAREVVRFIAGSERVCWKIETRRKALLQSNLSKSEITIDGRLPGANASLDC